MCRIVDTCMQLKIKKHMDFSAGPVGKNLPVKAHLVWQLTARAQGLPSTRLCSQSDC